MRSDAVDEYYQCSNARTEILATLCTYQSEMNDALLRKDMDTYSDRRIRADMLKRSLHIVETNLSKCEQSLMYAFQDHRPES